MDEGIVSLADDVLKVVSHQKLLQDHAAGIGRLDDVCGGFGKSHFVGGHRDGQRVETGDDPVRSACDTMNLMTRFVSDQMTVADVRAAQRFGDPIQEHQAFALVGREELQEGIQVHRLFIGHVVIHPVEQHKGDTRRQRGLRQRDLLLDRNGQAGGVIGVGDDKARDLTAFGAANYTPRESRPRNRPNPRPDRRAPTRRSRRPRTAPSYKRSTARARP